MFDEFNCVFIDNGQDLQYKELNWFLECGKFVYIISEYFNVPKREFAFVISDSNDDKKSPTYSFIS